ncbi:MAG: hypothetical protein L0241_03290, partial [Planctomycetia bacterium]|nr:hypothetical protein [Planctomycetia bacterium]
MSEPSVTKSYATAQAVFVGTVVNRSPVRWELSDGSQQDGFASEFTVVKGWKGADSERIVVVSGIGTGDCGYPFEVGQTYLVYASLSSTDELSTNICTRTGSLPMRVDDVGELERRRVIRYAAMAVLVLGLVA